MQKRDYITHTVRHIVKFYDYIKILSGMDDSVLFKVGLFLYIKTLSSVRILWELAFPKILKSWGLIG